ncbi:class II aldolase and Adducin N-terminal domain-containing protein [Talaromyces proteolyticus]|uniref:Class II aldolase and Adducin N-terminal domain-containing protein n=1 Tax=Talaromyces proteolyticus TaxID=1131652 RepID=A0AAD4Q0H4_9EURO|nr:class II aldolase and Adducin N-terminal domain-containing protein [Talaromyces proteolyticus]KAH8700819.1 class II aldolase and Adducin N-terminal domain-containing protein [Talaromyces proteolyticus]
MSSNTLREALRELVYANHILHYHDAVDAYGHVSIRHPEKPDVYIMSGYLAPALVESPDDLIEYYIHDSSPVNPDSKKGYQERFIHGEVFKRYPEINCVVHSHAEQVLPYTMNGVALRPAFHMAGFLGQHVPIYDITKFYQDGDQQDMLVNTVKFGSELANLFTETNNSLSPNNKSPDHTVVLMKRHGFTTLGKNVPEAVYRALYTKTNAGVQTNAVMLHKAYFGSQAAFDQQDLPYLNGIESEGCRKMNEGTQDKPWKLWVREVEASSLYKNLT